MSIEFSRFIKQFNKASRIVLTGLRPSGIAGRLGGPRVLLNSIPKSGTNLLQELVLHLPLMRGRVAKTYTLAPGAGNLCKMIGKIKKGQCVPAHISYDAQVAQTISDCDIRHILIIRDFRDVILSNIQYLDTIHIGHPHNAVFATLKSMDEKISACLEGIPDVQMMAWPELIHSYRKWVGAPNTLVVKYEDLVSQDSRVAEGVINQIAGHMNIEPQSFDASRVRVKMRNSRGLTYNAPGTGKWKINFNEAQAEKLTLMLKDELEFFGYPTN